MKVSQTQSERTSSTFTVHNAESAPEASRPFIPSVSVMKTMSKTKHKRH